MSAIKITCRLPGPIAVRAQLPGAIPIAARQAAPIPVRCVLPREVAPPPPAWSPADMLATGAGAYYDPSDIGNLYQDAALTIPVTAPGQPCWVRDSCPSGFSLVNGVAATYALDGGKPGIATDGNAQYIYSPHTDLAAGDGTMYLAVAVRYPAPTNGNNFAFSYGWRSVNDSTLSLGMRGGNWYGALWEGGGDPMHGGPTDALVHVLECETTGGAQALYVDGVPAATSARTGNFEDAGPATRICIGGWANGSRLARVNIFGATAYTGTQWDRAHVTAWLQARLPA